MIIIIFDLMRKTVLQGRYHRQLTIAVDHKSTSFFRGHVKNRLAASSRDLDIFRGFLQLFGMHGKCLESLKNENKYCIEK